MRIARRWRDQRGQSTVLVASMLFVLVLFVAMLANVGQAVNRRMAVQMVADTGAYTGATVMAVGLNAMAVMNKRIQDGWVTLAWATAGFWITHHSVSMVAPPLYKVWRAAFAGGIRLVNFVFSQLPEMEARRVSMENVADLFPGEQGRFEDAFDEWDPALGIFNARSQFSDMPIEEVSEDSEPHPAIWNMPFGMARSQHNPWWFCFTACVGFVCDWHIETDTFSHWYRKSGDDPQYFVWRVTAPAVPSMMFDDIFGPIPEMSAIAVAKPVGGSIEEGTDTYVAKMVPVARASVVNRYVARWLPAALFDTEARRFRAVFH